MAEPFQGEIVVASRIVDYLSSGLYESPSACLKELINNAYDADATKVEVFVKPDADRIIVADNGHGMDRADFQRHFSRISESYKREASDMTAHLGRPKIGKIGIGFIAANEICDVMEIQSTKRGTTELLKVEIRFDLMRQPPQVRRRTADDMAKADYRGTVGEENHEEHYTHVFLKKIKGEAREIVVRAGPTEFTSGSESIYGLGPPSVQNVLKSGRIRSWSDFDTYSRNILEIGLNVPVPYHDHWMPRPFDQQVADFTEEAAALDFRVFVDGSEIRKPTVFRESANSFVSRFDFQGDCVAARGYFYVQHGTLRPQELRGLLLRIRNAAIGEYDPTFLNFSPSRGPLFQSWISAEIWADDRLEDAMNIDRRTLRAAHPAFIELQRAVHQHFSSVLKRARNEVYGAGSEERKKRKAHDVKSALLEVAKSSGLEISPRAAQQLEAEFKQIRDDESGRKRLLQKYRVDELYEMVVEVARQTLDGSALERFLTALAKRISGGE